MKQAATETGVPAQPAPANHVAANKALLGVYLLSLALGGWIGSQGVGIGYWQASLPLTPKARIGYALAQDISASATDAWQQLASDIESAALSFAAEDRPWFRLVVAARGFDNAGVPRRDQVKHHCESLQLSRCDDSALDFLQRKSRP
jgi:hypothetical protein